MNFHVVECLMQSYDCLKQVFCKDFIRFVLGGEELDFHSFQHQILRPSLELVCTLFFNDECLGKRHSL